MREDTNFELKVGLFVAVGIIIFFIIVFSIGDIHVVKKGYRVNAVFNFVNGISESAPVRLAGVDVGYIDKINLYHDKAGNKTKVEIKTWINSRDVSIEKNSRATINTLGLLGEKYLEIFPGTHESGVLKDNDTLAGEDPVIMQNLADTMTSLAKSADEVLANIKEGKGTVGKLLTDDTVYNDLEAFVADIKAHPWKLLNKPRGE